jgi:ferric-dicitrate binding protein FerR (iron transport regulator)
VSDSTDLRYLFADYTSGEISAEQLRELEAALREDSDLRREFIEYMNVDSALGDLAALSEAESAKVDRELTALASDDAESMVGTAVRPDRTYRAVAMLGTVAAALFIAAMLWFTILGDDEVAPVATLITDVDAVLLCEGQPWSNTELQAGEYRLDRGLLHLRFSGNVMVYVEAPARFDAVSDKRVVLHKGRLSASVPPEGIGFTVETREAEIIDFGTEFSVDVEAGTSEVHVFEGLVRVQPIAAEDGKAGEAVDLRTSQAVKIEDVTETPVEIKLATDRFIRNFDEPKRKYARSVKQCSPVAFYRMPIRDRGLVSEPPQYSGEVLTGDGKRPPHAKGVFVGGALRVRADSSGRGGRVDAAPTIGTGKFTLAVFAYLESPAPEGVVATNLLGDQGNYSLSLDHDGRLQATVRNIDGELRSVTSDAPLPLTTWRHFVMTCDGEQLQIYEDGRRMASTACSAVAISDAETTWFGTDADGVGLWNGRIDELALFDKALSDKQIVELYQAAVEELSVQ